MNLAARLSLSRAEVADEAFTGGFEMMQWTRMLRGGILQLSVLELSTSPMKLLTSAAKGDSEVEGLSPAPVLRRRSA